MKYNDNSKPLVCMQTTSTCYNNTGIMQVKGILIHSTGANNPYIKRYVQPSDNAPDREQMLQILGVNQNHNDWNHKYVEAGLNAWIGKLADGTIATVQTMPWNYCPWGCGGGKYGSCNNGWIQFEICEDGLTDRNYFNAIYKEMTELVAYLCKMYNLDPHGTATLNGMLIPVILCHQDSARLGFSNHSDIYNWFPKFGKTIDDVRNDVAALLNTASPEMEDDDDMTQEKFNEMMDNYLNTRAKEEASAWELPALLWAQTNGIMNGDEQGNLKPHAFLTRGEASTILMRLTESLDK